METKVPLLPDSPQLQYKAELRGDGAPVLAQRVARAIPQVQKQTALSYSTGKINKTESLLIFCKQDVHSKKLELPQNIQNQSAKTV